jgi:hypothetical protein
MWFQLKQRIQQWFDRENNGVMDVLTSGCVAIMIEIQATVVFEVYGVDKVATVVF